MLVTDPELASTPDLAAMGVTADVLPRMVEGALRDHSTATNPRPLTAADFERLYDEAMRGRGIAFGAIAKRHRRSAQGWP